MQIGQTQLLDAIAKIAPNRYLQALVIMVLFLLVAKIADMIMTRIIRRWRHSPPRRTPTGSGTICYSIPKRCR